MLAITMQVAVRSEMVLGLGEEKFERTGRSSSGSPGWIQTKKSEPGTLESFLAICRNVKKLTAP
jgi:hypothetical protein